MQNLTPDQKAALINKHAGPMLKSIYRSIESAFQEYVENIRIVDEQDFFSSEAYEDLKSLRSALTDVYSVFLENIGASQKNPPITEKEFLKHVLRPLKSKASGDLSSSEGKIAYLAEAMSMKWGAAL